MDAVKFFKEVEKAVPNFSDQDISVNWDYFIKKTKLADTHLLDFINTTNNSQISLANYQNYLQATAQQTSKFSQFTKAAGNVAKSFGASLLNMGAGVLAGMAIQGLVTWIYDMVTATEQAIQKGEEAQSTIKDTFDTISNKRSNITQLGRTLSDSEDDISSTSDAIQALGEKYDELSAGVNRFDNSNLSLDDSQYQNFLDISNQLAELFPSLVSGYDSQGNAILNLGNGAESTTEQLRDLLDVQTALANSDIGEQLQDAFDGIIASSQKYDKEKGSLEADIQAYQEQIASVKDLYSEENLSQNFPNGVPNKDALQTESAKKISELTQDSIAGIQEAQKEIQDIEHQQDTLWQSANTSLSEYIQTQSSFLNLTDNLQTAFLKYFNNLDLRPLLENYDGDIDDFLDQKFLVPLSEFDSDAQSVLTELLSIDSDSLNLSSYKNAIQEMLSQAFPGNKGLQDQVKQFFGFDDVLDDLDKQQQELFDRFGMNIRDIQDFTNEDLEIAYDIVAHDGFSGTFTELKKEIQEVKNETAGGFDIHATPQLDEVEGAFETENAGVNYESIADYIKQAKDLYDEGLVGTDDFKSIAKLISPTGMDDASNFIENYNKISDYFDTDSAQGIQNFLEDLQALNKGYAEFDEATGTWTTHFDDLEQAAKDMGMGFEPFISILDRMSDYGAANNFFSNTEEGIQHLTDLYSQLSDEEMKLSQLQSEDPGNQTAIDATQAKIDTLKASIQESLGYLEQLTHKSAEDTESEVASAAQAYETLRQEREKTLQSGGEYAESVAGVIQDQMDALAEEYHLDVDANINWDNEDPENNSIKIPGEIDISESSFDDIQNKATQTPIELSAAFQPISPDVQNLPTYPAPTSANTQDVNIRVHGEEDLQAAQKIIDDLSGTDIAVNLIASSAKAENAVRALRAYALNQDVNVRIDGESTLANDEIESVKETAEQTTGTVTINGDPTAANQELSATIAGINNSTGTINVDADTSGLASQVQNDLNSRSYSVNVTANVTPSSSTGFLAGTNIGYIPRANGTPFVREAHFNDGVIGRAYLQGGTVGEPVKTQALTGELGPEMVVRGNRFFIVGDAGPEFVQLQKGDIVFNHKQTRELLSNGKTDVRGRALVEGNARAGIGGNSLKFQGGASTVSASSSPSSSASSSASTSSSSKESEKETESALDKLLEKLGRLFDWIEVRIDRLQSKIDLNLAKSENATTYQGKNKYVNRAANNTSTLLSVEEKALKRYSKQADSIAQQVGLSATLKKRVQNGTIDIEELSEDDQKRVDIYKEWYDKVVDTRQAIQDLKQQQKELAQTKLDNIVEQYETITGLAEAAQNTSAAIVDYNTSAGKAVDNSSTKKQIQNQMAQQQKITNKLRNERSAYVKELQKAKKVFGENSNEYREAKEQFENLKESIYESRTAYNELNDQLRELDLTKIQYVVDIFTNAADRIKSVLDLKSARGETVTESDYTNQMSTNNQLINQLYGQRQEYLEDLLSNDKFSEKWKEAYDNINTIDQTIMGLLQDNEALKDSIWEVRWKPFTDLQERRDNQISDNDFMLDQISDEMTLDDKGNLTSAGEDVLAITGENIDLTNQKIADYREALDKLGEDLANGNISQDEYNEKSREYIEVIQDAVSANKDYNDSIVEIYKNQITKQNEALQDYIDIRQEANQKDQEAYEYQKKLKSQYKDVSALRAQILALEGTTNLQGQAELERLKAELSEQEDSLDDTIRDHRYDMIDQGYDQLSQNAQDNLDKTLEELESNADRQREVVDMMLSDVKKSYEDAYAEIRKIIESTNITVTTPNVTVTNTVTDPIDTSVGGDTTKAEQAASGNPVSSGTGSSSGGQTGSSTSNSGAPVSLAPTAEDEKRRKEEEKKLKEEADKAERQRLLNIAKDIIASIKKQSLTDKQVSSHSSLFQYVYRKSGRPLYDDDAYFLGKSIGVSMPKSVDKLNATYKRNILTKLKEIGYEKGTKDYRGDGLAWMDEAGAGSEMIIRKSDNAILTRLQPHDQIVPEAMTKNLWSWASIDPAALMQANSFVPDNATSAETTQINLGGMNITMNGRVYKDDIDWYRQMPESVVREMGKRLDTYFARDFEKTGRGRCR